MKRLVLLACALAAVAASGCGGDDGRDRVESYIREANEVQRKYVKDFEAANKTYVAYSKNELKGSEAIEQLATARDRIAAAENELAELDPPQEAKGLHAKLLRVYDMNGEFAEQTALLASYLDSASGALKPLDRANRQLRRGLREDELKRQERALGRFVSALDGVLGKLNALDVPRVLGPTHDAQVARLSRTRRLSAKLRRALLDQDARALATALKRFRKGAPAPSGRLARQAIKQYDRRYKQLNDAYADVTREQKRLQELFS